DVDERDEMRDLERVEEPSHLRAVLVEVDLVERDARVVARGLLEARHLREAWLAPGRPEIEDDRLALERGQSRRLARRLDPEEIGGLRADAAGGVGRIDDARDDPDVRLP